jgi:Carboxypeptidase regulatory-like domain/TonB dependent receptor
MRYSVRHSLHMTFLRRFHSPGSQRLHYLHALVAACLLLLPARHPASAQATGGSISGTVADQSGAVVPGAKVTAINLDTTAQQTATTNAQGFYAFPNLAVGRYEIQVEQTGFQPFRRTGLVIDIGTELRSDVSLTLSAQKSEVVVKAQAEEVQPETQQTQMGETIAAPQIEATPLNGRAFTDILNVQAGVIPVTTQPPSNIIMAGVTDTPPSGSLNPGNVSVEGQPENANGFVVNGSDVEEDVNMGTAIIPNLESIDEFRILTNNFDAKYGNYSGGLVIVSTKAGTNAIHGDVFEFVRNTALDAQGYFATVKPAYDQNQFGGTVGGPIKRNKIFWFVDYQGTRTSEGIDTGLVDVPSLADRTGNLSDLASTLTGAVSTPYVASVLSGKLGYSVSAGEPYYTPACTSTSACVFPGAVIPMSAWSAPAKFLLPYIPTPNVGTNLFESAAEDETIRDDKGGIRVDANTTRWGNLLAYYFDDAYTLNNPYPTSQGGANVPSGMGGSFNALSHGRAQLITVGDVKTFGNNNVNEFHFSYMRDFNNIGQPSGGVGVSLACQGFYTAIPDPLGTSGCPGTTNTVTSYGIYPLDPSVEGIENVSLANLGDTIGTPITNAVQTNNTYQWLDNFSKIVGTHTVTFGGEFHFDQINETPNATFNGSYVYNGAETGSDYADFLLGIVSTYVQADQGSFYPRNKYAGFFGQDSWRVTPKLTLNYGLRWDLIRSWYEKYNQLSTFVPGEQSVVFPGAPTGFLVPLDPGVPRTISPARYNNLAPRLGLAYAPDFKNPILQKVFGKAGQSSIRAGFGMLYTAIPGISAAIMYSIAPYGYNYVQNSVLASDPMCTTADPAPGGCFTQPFPTHPPTFGASPSNPNNTVNWSLFEPIVGDPAYATDNRIPYSEEYFLSFQRQFKTNLLLSVSYVGSESHHQLAITPFNSANPAACLAEDTVSNPNACGPDSLAENETRPLWSEGIGGDSLQETIGNSSYNAFQAVLRYAGPHGNFLASYTYSKCLTDSSALGEEVLASDLDYTRGLCSFDIRHNFVITYQYNLPIGDLLNRHTRLTDGWSLSGTTRLSTGLPVTISDSVDDSLLGTNPNGVNDGYIDRPNCSAGPLNLSSNPVKGTAFNTSLFSQETLGTLGDCPIAFFSGPGLIDFDVALLKDVPIKESKSFQFRWEAYNVFNKSQFFISANGQPAVQGNFTNPQFGQIVGSMNARIMQLSLKFHF